jgi:putative tryptophan/tyrosine transport system substrate-binding protein
LRERGYIEGQNVIVEFRTAAGRLDALPGLAAELVALNPDVIFAPAESALRACVQASSTIPIVIAAAEYDPVEAGIVTSIAHPGNNITGVFFRQVETSGKRVELLKEAVPELSRVAIFVEAGGKFQLDETQRAARSLGITISVIELSSRPIFDKVFAALINEHVGALIVLVSPITYAQRATIASLAIKNRLPAIAPFNEFADEGGLLSYGASFATLFRYAAAHYVDPILQGARPGDLPIEQPGKFELSINIKTAKALGMVIPSSLLVRADHLVE